jgi:hypothetical protein
VSITFRVAQLLTDDEGVYLAQVPETPELNVNKRNAADLLSVLGYAEAGDVEFCGEAPSDEFLGRVLLALGLLDIATDDAHGLPEVEEGRFIECGRAPEYLHDRLAELQSIAEHAKAHDLLVDWC